LGSASWKKEGKAAETSSNAAIRPGLSPEWPFGCSFTLPFSIDIFSILWEYSGNEFFKLIVTPGWPGRTLTLKK
jgi:hypothetical protein